MGNEPNVTLAAPVAQKVTPPETPIKTETPKVETPVISTADILKRSSPPQAVPEPVKETNYREDLEKITDPAVKAIAEKQLKDLESGYNKKFQTLAQQRKELEDLKAKVSTWTPQRLAEELRNPAFVQAAQTLQQQAPPQDWSGSTEEWSSLNDSEKREFQRMRQEQSSLQSQVARMVASQEDTEIKKIYPTYDSNIVEEAIEGLRSGKINISRVDIFKAVNHDKNVESGYQYGYEDGYKKALEKLNGSSISTSNSSVTSADEVPEEVRKGGFSSIAMWRLAKAKNGSAQKR